MRKRSVVQGDRKVERNWVQKDMMRYEIVESSKRYCSHGTMRNATRLHLYLEHPVQGNMDFCVSNSRDELFHLRISKDHLDSIMVSWDEAVVERTSRCYGP